MPEFDCFITIDEYAELLATALSNGFRLCLKKRLLAPKHEYVPDSEAIPVLLESRQYAFLLERNDFTHCPVELRETTRDGQKMWFPLETNGGPVIETYFWRPFEKQGSRTIPCSLIAHGRLFERTGEPIKKAYATIVAPLRKKFRRVHSARRTQVAYVSAGVDAILDAGWRLAEPFSGSPPR
jgi:hypothetical protein